MFSGKPLPYAEYASDALLELTRKNAAVSKLDEQALSFFRSNAKTSLIVINEMVSRGSGFLAGCDGLVPGFCLHDELQWMTAAGLSPLQAIQTATINAAKFLEREKNQGTIEVGKRADLVLLDADPLTDIRNTRRISAVVVRGRLLARPDIERIIAAHKRPSSNSMSRDPGIPERHAHRAALRVNRERARTDVSRIASGWRHPRRVLVSMARRARAI